MQASTENFVLIAYLVKSHMTVTHSWFSSLILFPPNCTGLQKLQYVKNVPNALCETCCLKWMVQYLFHMFDFVWTSEDTNWFSEFNIKHCFFFAQQTSLLFEDLSWCWSLLFFKVFSRQKNVKHYVNIINLPVCYLSTGFEKGTLKRKRGWCVKCVENCVTSNFKTADEKSL